MSANVLSVRTCGRQALVDSNTRRKGGRKMSGLIGLLVAVPLVFSSTDTTSTREEFQELGNLVQGRWIGDITLIADWPGLNRKQGEKVIGYQVVRWVADGHALLTESIVGDGTSQMFEYWDPISKQIRGRMVSNGGETWESVMWKSGENTWSWKLEGALLDGTHEHGSGMVVFEDGGNTQIITGTSYLGGKELLPLRDVYRRVGGAADRGDRAALADLLEECVRSLNDEDLEANKRLFAEDGDHINPMGRAGRGPDAIATMLAEAFEEFSPWKSKCRILETQFLRPDVAIEIREWTTLEAPLGVNVVDPALELLVHVKRSGKWMILAARPLIPFRAEHQVMPAELPTAAGFSDPEFAEEVKEWSGSAPLAENVMVITARGKIHRGKADVQAHLDRLQGGRTSLTAVLNSARRIGDDVAIADWGYEATGRWTAPDLAVMEGPVRGLWCAVYSRENGQWVLSAAREMIPYIVAP